MKKKDKHDKQVDPNLNQQVDPSTDGELNLDSQEGSENSEEATDTDESLLAEKDQKITELTDQYVRLLAEYDNFRRRSRQEKDQLYAQSVTDVVGEWLPIIDNLERAMAISDASENQEVKQFSEGLSLVMRQVEKTLEKLNVEKLDPLGESFNPNLHSAVLHIDDDSYAANEIVEVLEKGYARNDKVIRHAIVKVAN